MKQKTEPENMCKLFLILIASLLLQSCSGLEALLPTPIPTKTPTPSATTTQIPTRTLTPTRTITPTLPNTATLISVAPTFTPFVLVSAGAPTAAYTQTPLTPLGGFESVYLTRGKIFYGICQPNFLKMTVKVEHPEEIQKVYLFLRLESVKTPGDTTPWTGTVTDNDGGGYFIYTLFANKIPDHRTYIKAWIHYQFVAENAEKEIVGRSQIYTRNLFLEACK